MKKMALSTKLYLSFGLIILLLVVLSGVYQNALECYDRTIDILRPSNNSIRLNELFIKKGQIFYEICDMPW